MYTGRVYNAEIVSGMIRVQQGTTMIRASSNCKCAPSKVYSFARCYQHKTDLQSQSISGMLYRHHASVEGVQQPVRLRRYC